MPNLTNQTQQPQTKASLIKRTHETMVLREIGLVWLYKELTKTIRSLIKFGICDTQNRLVSVVLVHGAFTELEALFHTLGVIPL